MLEKQMIFHTNFLPKTVIVRLNNTHVVCGVLVDKRRKIKINFKTKKKKVVFLTPATIASTDFFVNMNSTVYKSHEVMEEFNIKKRYPHALRRKIKWKFKKFKYRGKGFKIKKYNKLGKLTFKMGRSHWTKALYNKELIVIKRTKKNTYCCITMVRNSLDNLKNVLLAAKGINKYTKRGVRLTRQEVKKRFGKISQASSVYK